MAIRGVAALCAVVVVAGALATGGRAGTVPAGFQETTVFGGLTFPTAVRFAPDGRVFVAEKSGLIKVFPSLTSTTPTVFADLRTEVDDYWDRGLLGLAVDPGFPARPYVYALYTYDAPIGGTAPTWNDACPTPPGPTTYGCVVSGRLVRLTASGDVAAGEQVLINDWCQQFPSHSIGDLRFGPDGALYASAGEGSHFFSVDIGDFGSPPDPCADPANEGGALRAQSLRRAPGEPVSLDGAVLRLDPATGAALPDNPLAASPDANARRIVAEGLRNPFRFTFRPGTNEVWIADVGWNDWEEIDRAAVAVAGAGVPNFGWPCFEGAVPQAGYQAAGTAICDALYARPGSTVPPYWAYGHNQEIANGDSTNGCPNNGSSVAGLAFYAGGGYPAEYHGALFFGDYARGCIYVMKPGADGLPDPSTRAVFDSNGIGPVDLELGPGGDLYYVDYDAGAVRRIHYLGANRPPTAIATASTTTGAAPLTVAFDASSSSDPDGDAITYAWDLNGDGVFDDSTAATPSYLYTRPGTYAVRVKVTDASGAATVSDAITISVSNTPPAPTISQPASSLTWKVGDAIAFAGSATDTQDGPLPASALTWTLIVHHCPAGCHTHVVQTFAGVASGTFAAPDHEYPSYLELQLTATDANGATATTSVELQPQTVTLGFDTRPSGLELTVGSTGSTTPFTRTVIVGSQTSIGAPTPQTLAGTTYDFGSWSDGGAQTHAVVAAAGASYVATYTARPAATNLLPNGGFDNGLTGWGGWHSSLSVASGAAHVANASTSGGFSIYTSPRPVAPTTAGTTYTGTGSVRSSAPGKQVCLGVREWTSSGVKVGEKTSCVTTTTSWQQIPAATYTTQQSGGSLELYVWQTTSGSGESFDVDNLGLAAASPPPSNAPPNDMFANAQQLSGASGTVTGDSTYATREAGEPIHAGSQGSNSVWYAWTASAGGTVSVDTAGSSFDTLLAVYTGTSVSALTQVAANDDTGGGVTSALSFTAAAGTTYRIAVDGWQHGGSLQLHWSLAGAAPPPDTTPPETTITGGPSGTVATTSASFTFTATETATFQCQLDAAAWTACTSPQSYSGLAAGSHTFSVRATDAAGNTDPTPAVRTWTIQTSNAPPNDMFANAQALSGSSGGVSGDSTYATREAGEPIHAGSQGSNSVWYAWTAPSAGTLTLDTFTSSFDTLLAVYTGATVSALTQVAANDDTAGGVTSKVTFAAVAGTTYMIAVDGWQHGGTVQLHWSLAASTTAPPPNDMFASAQPLSGSAGTVTGSSVYATRESGEPVHAGSLGNSSVWYTWTAPSAGTLTLDTFGSDFDTLLAVYTGTSVSALTQVAANDDAAGGVTSQLSFAAVAGAVYRIAVDGWQHGGAVTLDWSFAAG